MTKHTIALIFAFVLLAGCDGVASPTDPDAMFPVDGGSDVLGAVELAADAGIGRVGKSPALPADTGRSDGSAAADTLLPVDMTPAGRPNGAACAAAGECASGFCVGTPGRCCDQACEGSCKACGTGYCENIKEGDTCVDVLAAGRRCFSDNTGESYNCRSGVCLRTTVTCTGTTCCFNGAATTYICPIICKLLANAQCETDDNHGIACGAGTTCSVVAGVGACR